MKILALCLIIIVIAAPAQAIDSIPYATGGLQWDWTQGAPPNDGIPTEFHLKCGTASGQYTMPVKIIPYPTKTIDLSAFLPGPSNTTYYCVVTAFNPASSPPEIGPSNEFPFVAAGGMLTPPANLRKR